MAALNSQGTKESVQFTEYGIPIRNLWHMLLYAWNELPLKEPWLMVDAESAPTLDGLLASALMKLMQGRLRIGLGRNYVKEKRKFRGIWGRIAFQKSLKHRAFDGGESGLGVRANT